MSKVNLKNVTGKIAYALEASDDDVAVVLAADPESDDGRSQWLWIWIDNNDEGSDLVLACFPQGDTYCNTEGDHS